MKEIGEALKEQRESIGITIEEAAADFKLNIQERGLNAYEEWNKVFEEYKENNPEKAAEFEAAFNGELPEGFETALEYVEYGSKADATRNSNGRVIQKISESQR